MRRTPRWLLLGMLVLFGRAATSHAGLKFGLGNAVANRSADLINKAGAYDAAHATGDAVAATLASCPAGPLYDALPTDLSGIAAIDPLGHVAPSPHTFPSDHVYFYRPIGSTTALPIYAPGEIHITTIRSSTVTSFTPSSTDYGIYFYPCRELKSYFLHVASLSASLQAQVGAIDQNCMTYTTGATYYACEKSVNITVHSGEIIGYTATSGAFDFGSYDYRQTPLAYVSPSRHPGDQLYIVCPIDYFTPGPKMDMEAILGQYNGGHPRTALPLCGKTMYDIAGKAKGYWYFPGAPDNPEDPHMSLIENNVYAPWQTISYGDSLPNAVQNFHTFIPTSAGFVNRDFADVTPDGQIYCYDTFYDPTGQAIGPGRAILIQMMSATTIKLEFQSVADCAAASPFALTANAVTFQR